MSPVHGFIVIGGMVVFSPETRATLSRFSWFAVARDVVHSLEYANILAQGGMSESGFNTIESI
jgi:hypothetical protein